MVSQPGLNSAGLYLRSHGLHHRSPLLETGYQCIELLLGVECMHGDANTLVALGDDRIRDSLYGIAVRVQEIRELSGISGEDRDDRADGVRGVSVRERSLLEREQVRWDVLECLFQRASEVLA